MAPKKIFLIAAAIFLASTVSALVAYRLGLRRSADSRPDLRAASESAQGGCVDIREAQSRVGLASCVSGRVLRVFTSRAGNAFLDFCPDYRHCPFTAVIFSADRGKFGDLETLVGRQVEIQGLVSVYQGRPEIIIHDPNQIRSVSQE